MQISDRTPWGFVLVLVATGLLAYSLVNPWFAYDFSSGRRAAEGGPGEVDDPAIVHTHIDYYPYRVAGNETPTDPQRAQELVDRIGLLVASGAGLVGLLILLEIPFGIRLATRWITMPGLAVALGLVAWAGAIAWFQLPDTLSGRGVTEPFSAVLVDDGYVRTQLDSGFFAAALSAAVLVLGIGFKFQAGAYDPSAVEAFKKAPKA